MFGHGSFDFGAVTLHDRLRIEADLARIGTQKAAREEAAGDAIELVVLDRAQDRRGDLGGTRDLINGALAIPPCRAQFAADVHRSVLPMGRNAKAAPRSWLRISAHCQLRRKGDPERFVAARCRETRHARGSALTA